MANQEYNRSSDFFEEYIRNEEYEVVLDLAMEALEYNDNVLINAPFTREIRDKAYIDHLKEVLKERDAKLVIVWVITDKEVCHQRMIERASDRDKWKLDNWDEYIASCNFDIPDTIMDPEDDLGLLLFHNSSEEEFNASLKEISEKLINS